MDDAWCNPGRSAGFPVPLKLPSRIVEFLPEKPVKEYAGNYDAYLSGNTAAQ
ncbi:MAG: hypothetical protein ACLRVT_10240 [Oscillospiraceae bacterium]